MSTSDWTKQQIDTSLAQEWMSAEAQAFGGSSVEDDAHRAQLKEAQSDEERNESKETQSDTNSAKDDSDSDSEDEKDLPPLDSVVTQNQANKGPNERILFDKCTIRTWFMAMNSTGDGQVSKQQFIEWLIKHPEFRKLLVKGEAEREDCDSKGEDRKGYAVIARRMIKFFKEIDVDNSKAITFKEFKNLFRRAGYLLEYDQTNNPRDNAERMLRRQSGQGPVDVHQAATRARRGSECLWYLQQEARLNAEVMSQEIKPETGDSYRNMSRTRRHSASAIMQLGLLKGPAAFWDDPVVLGGGNQSPKVPGAQRTRRGSEANLVMPKVTASMPNF